MSESQPERKLIIEGDWKSDDTSGGDEAASAGAPKLHVDSDWKAQAQAEKERLAAAENERETDRGDRGMPEASFKTLMSLLASQAVMGLGAMTDPQSGGVVIDLEGAKLSIDLLDVLQEKTKGNLEEDESTELTQLLTELRARFVQITQLVAQQQARTAAAGGGAGPGGSPMGG